MSIPCSPSAPPAPGAAPRPRACGASLGCAIALSSTAFAATGAGQEGKLAFVQVPKVARPAAGAELEHTLLSGRYRRGSRLVLADPRDVAGTLRILSEGFDCATDPAFTHDGARLFFAGARAAGSPLQIWALSAGATEPEPVTALDADCVGPVAMPDGGVAFASLLAREYEEHGAQLSFSLFALPPHGDEAVRLTFNPSSDFEPAVLEDGRLVYSSWQHVGNHASPRGNVMLMLLNADGTGVFPFAGAGRGPWSKRGATTLADDWVAFVQAESATDFAAGELVAASLQDPFGPGRTLVPASRFEVADVASLSDGRLLLSARPADGARATFGLYVQDHGEVQPSFDDPEFHELAPALGFAAKLPDSPVSTVVPGTAFGHLLVLDCCETDGAVVKRPRPGSVASVRVIEGLPLLRRGGVGPAFVALPGREQEPLASPVSAVGGVPSRILGEVAPAEDGSLYLKVPADRPLRLQLLDGEGFSIANQRSWIWVRPNERRACIGCHEDRELSPRNLSPLATQKPAADLTDPSRWQTITFQADIRPIVQASCAVTGCHVPPHPTGGMVLLTDRLPEQEADPLARLFGPAYANLLAREAGKPFAIGGRRVHPGDARSSPLCWMLYGRELAPQYEPAPFEGPTTVPHLEHPLSAESLALIRKWIDLGAPYAAEAPAGPWPYTFPIGEVQER